MERHNPSNERIKRKYLSFLKEANRNSEQTVDATAKALSRFEVYTKHRDFKAFHCEHEQAVAFKRHLANQNGQRSGGKLSKSTLHLTLSQLKRFFGGYRCNLGTSRVFNIPMPNISTCLAKTPALPLLSGSKAFRPSNKSSISLI